MGEESDKNDALIDVRKLIANKNPRLLKWLPGFVLRYLENILHQDEINEFLRENRDLKNHEFCHALIDFFKIKVEIIGLENIPKTGGATLAMNHPLGGMDAVAFISAISAYRKDVKFIVNDLLLNLEPLKGLFVGVNKHGRNSGGVFRQLDEVFTSGGLVCVFPAGLVSRKIKGVVSDLPWKKTFVTQAKKNNLPIIPIYIDGKLSNFFYRLHRLRSFLGIKVNLEMLYLANEMFKQRNVKMKFVIGKPLMPNELDTGKKDQLLAQEIRSNVYQLNTK